MGGTYGIVCCNIYVGYFINVLQPIIINPYSGGFVNQNYIHWNAMVINWDYDDTLRPQSSGIYMAGEGEPNHNTFDGCIECYYIALRLSGAFNRFLGFRAEECDYSVLINDAGTPLGTRSNTIFGDYGDTDSFYIRIFNEQSSSYSIEYAVQIYGPGGLNLLQEVWADDYHNNSDSSLKINIKPIVSPLKKVLSLRGTRYQRRMLTPDQKKKNEKKFHYGFIAQEVKEILPDLVRNNPCDSLLGINYIEIIPVLVEAIKEQESEIKELSSKVQKLDKLVNKSIPSSKRINIKRK